MKRFVLAVIALCILALPIRAEVESAADYFNLGAATFIRENPEPALAIVNEGLVFYPEDESLIRLKALIEQQQEQQNQNNSSDDSDQQDQDSQAEQNESGENQNEQSPDEEEESEQEPPEENEGEQNEGNEEEQEQDQPQPSDLNEDEAEMVLDSLRQLEEAQRERIMQDMIKRQMQNMPPVEKDW